MSFRDNLQHLRSTRNMTQEQLAMLLGVSRQAVSKWESERAYPEMDKLLKICTLFECSLDDLVTGDLTQRRADKNLSIPPGQKTQDITDYDKTMVTYAWKLSFGVLWIILGVVLSILWISFSKTFGNGLSNYAAVIMGIGIVGGLVLIVPTVFVRNEFQRAHPFIEDFYTAEQKYQARMIRVKGVSFGLILLVIGIMVAFLSRSFELLAWAVFLFFLAASSFSVVWGWLLWKRIDIENYNQKSFSLMTEEEIASLNDVELQKIAHNAKQKRRVCTIIMSLATVFGLIFLFIPQLKARQWFWLTWFIGWILCMVAKLWTDLRVRGEKS